MTNSTSELQRLRDATAAVAATIIEIIDERVRAGRPSTSAAAEQDASKACKTQAEAWVGKRGVAEHLHISVRTVDVWMAKGLLPYMRIGKSVRFKLSEVDEALKFAPGRPYTGRQSRSSALV